LTKPSERRYLRPEFQTSTRTTRSYVSAPGRKPKYEEFKGRGFGRLATLAEKEERGIIRYGVNPLVMFRISRILRELEAAQRSHRIASQFIRVSCKLDDFPSLRRSDGVCTAGLRCSMVV